MRVRGVLFFSLVASMVVIIGLSLVFPVIDDLMVENPFWNGLSDAYVLLDPTRVKELSALTVMVEAPSNSTLLIVGPSKGFSRGEVEAVQRFLDLGGLVVLADDFGTGNGLLEGLNAGVRFEGVLLQDQLFKEKNGLMPRIYDVDARLFDGVDCLVMNCPSVLSRSDDGCVAWSSPFSYVSDAPSLPTGSLKTGPFPVVANLGIGEGRLVVISDSSLFINSMIERGGNSAFLLGLVRGEVYIDEAHLVPSRLSSLRSLVMNVYSVLEKFEARYGLSILVVLLMFNVKWEKGEDEGMGADEVVEVLREHPEYDRRLLERLDEERRAARGYR